MTGSTACGWMWCRTFHWLWLNERFGHLCVENNRLHTESLARLLEIERLDGVIEWLKAMVPHEYDCPVSATKGRAICNADKCTCDRDKRIEEACK